MDVCVCVCVSVCLSVCVSVCLSVCKIPGWLYNIIREGKKGLQYYYYCAGSPIMNREPCLLRNDRDRTKTWRGREGGRGGGEREGEREWGREGRRERGREFMDKMTACSVKIKRILLSSLYSTSILYCITDLSQYWVYYIHTVTYTIGPSSATVQYMYVYTVPPQTKQQQKRKLIIIIIIIISILIMPEMNCPAKKKHVPVNHLLL